MFVIMIQDHRNDALTRYKAFLSTEPELRKVYESRQRRVWTIEEGEGDDTKDPSNLAEREWCHPRGYYLYHPRHTSVCL